MEKNEELVRSYLEDEESKSIFDARLEYNKNNDETALKNITTKVFEKCMNYSGIDLSELSYKKVYIYGRGLDGSHLVKFFGILSMKIDGIIDTFNHGDIISGIKVYSPDEVDYDKIDVLIISMNNERHVKECFELLQNKEIKKECKFVYWSKFVKRNQYFDDIITYNDNEVFADAGVYDLGTTLRFFEECKKYNIANSKSIAFEPSEENYEECLKIKNNNSYLNIELVNAGLYSESTQLYFDDTGNSSAKINENGGSSINVITLDSYVKDAVTFIKMDIEGAELEALKGCKETIIKYKPKLAICVYHKPEDIIEIPMYIKSLVPEYKFYLRHYTLWAGETVLYAIP